MTVDPGICGFPCVIRASTLERRRVRVRIVESECQQILRLAGRLDEISLRELFMPAARNPVYQSAEASGCHASCVIPAAVLKAAEVAMGMALPKDVSLRFQASHKKGGNAPRKSHTL